jgi:hypothetical protein
LLPRRIPNYSALCQIQKANPAFRDREDLAAAIRKGRRMPAEEPKVRNLFLNQRVALVAALIAPQTWKIA